MAKHFKKTKTSAKALFILIVALCCMQLIQQFTKISFAPQNNDGENELYKPNIHTFSNASYLQSENFSLTVEDGISTINATIINNSAETLNNLKCLYCLMDSTNNIVYSFDISINSIEPNTTSSFACMAMLDLSNVVDYSVSLFEQ